MTAPFTITVDDAQVQAALSRLIRHVSDLTPIMEDIGRGLGNLTHDAFLNEGPGWPQLQPATVKQRGSAHPILRQSAGGLAASITHGGDRNSAWVGASKIYAAIHQFGGTVEHQARTSTVYFRQNQRTGQVGNRFVKKRKSNFAQDVSIGAYSVTLPPRPFLPMLPSGALTPAAHDEVMDILTRALRAAIGQG
ncbi:MAG: phage virion morphogenesis protein [Chromatiaceae bacterium]|nr:phage virion morphogenesis protein [Chromatiaceae bacterium]